jgi:hypothetical protein
MTKPITIANIMDAFEIMQMRAAQLSNNFNTKILGKITFSVSNSLFILKRLSLIKDGILKLLKLVKTL